MLWNEKSGMSVEVVLDALRFQHGNVAGHASFNATGEPDCRTLKVFLDWYDGVLRMHAAAWRVANDLAHKNQLPWVDCGYPTSPVLVAQCCYEMDSFLVVCNDLPMDADDGVCFSVIIPHTGGELFQPGFPYDLSFDDVLEIVITRNPDGTYEMGDTL